MNDLAQPCAGPAMWTLFREGKTVFGERVRTLLQSDDPAVTWRAAAILAAWGDAAAEPRLVQAVTEREEGSEYNAAKDNPRAMRKHKTVPRWWASAALLRLCGTPAGLPALSGLAATPELQLNARNIVALTCTRIAERHPLTDQDRRRIEETLAQLLATPLPHAAMIPNRDPVSGEAPYKRGYWLRVVERVREDFTWQVHFAVARARKTLGLGPLPEARGFLKDRRAIVRRAFERVLGA